MPGSSAQASRALLWLHVGRRKMFEPVDKEENAPRQMLTMRVVYPLLCQVGCAVGHPQLNVDLRIVLQEFR